ncbi:MULTISPECIES: hypothetical protein [Psychrobacter]|uniref:SH3 domain-containing protein n=1 Tax=Psychrobacter fozii TaxID=198480 RepID=A0A2V4UCU6_9GAMM|nr:MULTISPECIES: hypothetical protein [Psychrobacter]MBH0064741.1 hypothetical protein [Psychrobacter sp. SZ93C1]PYE36479.1 hypothetical protein DFP82_11515 [Psychrobacter fozii]
MSKILKPLFICFSIMLVSCSVNSPANDPNDSTLENTDRTLGQDKATIVKNQKVSFDSIIKCNGNNLFTFNEGHFYYPDYGCIYSDSNRFGDIQVFLFPKNNLFIPNKMSEFDSVVDDVNALTLNEIKNNFEIFVRVIDKSDLVFTKDLDSPYYIKDNPKKLVYYFDGTWKLINTKEDIDQDPFKFYVNFAKSNNKGSNKINSEEVYKAKDIEDATKAATEIYPKQPMYGTIEAFTFNGLLSLQEIKKDLPKDQFEIFTFDVNADDIDDLVVSRINDDNDFFQGNELYVLTRDKSGKYTLSLSTQSYTTETGWSLSNILPRRDHSGFIISTQYSTGRSEYTFYYTFENGKWYIANASTEGSIATGEEYYCIDHNKSSIDNFITLIGSYPTEADELVRNCPLPPTKYTVKTDQAEILNEKFKSRSKPNYYIKGDLIEAVDQNEDWVKVAYKEGTKFGWIDKRDLSPISD